MKSQFLIGSITPGCGKTTFMLGLMRLLQQSQYTVQPYKCGPDDMDAQFHSWVGNRDSIHLDNWLAGRSHLQYTYNKHGEGANVCVLDGQMGLFDGYRTYLGSSAEMASILRIPVVILVNARDYGSYSLAPMLYGFKNFYKGIKIAGVVFTGITSKVQFSYLKLVCSDAGLECFGYLPYYKDLKFPQRYVGSTTITKNETVAFADQIATDLKTRLDLNKLLQCTQREFPCRYTLPYSSEVEDDTYLSGAPKLKIAVAQDPAFHPAYRENIEQLSKLGTITYFSPLYGQNELPEADIYYFPSGYPELFVRQLHRWRKLMEKIKNFADQGGKILAEGGGMIFLSDSLSCRFLGKMYKMVGIFPYEFFGGLKTPISGYRLIDYNGMKLRGYEYNYASTFPQSRASFNRLEEYKVAQSYNLKGDKVHSSLYRYKNVIATPMRLYLGEVDIEKLWL